MHIHIGWYKRHLPIPLYHKRLCPLEYTNSLSPFRSIPSRVVSRYPIICRVRL